MLTTKDTGLVSGVPLASTPLTAVRVLRGFFVEDGKAVKAGDILHCSERFARSVIANGKAERVELVTIPAVVVESSNAGATANAGPAVVNVGGLGMSEEHVEKPSRRGRRITNEE